MFLSRMTLNPRRRGTRLLRANPQAMHAAVMSAFPPGAERRPLWRLDESGERVDLLLLSATRPSFEHLQEQAGWSAQPTGETRDYGPLLDRLQLGQRYGFRLTANPTHIAEVRPGVKRRVGHVSPRHQIRWLVERQERLGVRFPEVPGDRPAADGGAEAPEPGPELAVRLVGRHRREFRHGAKPITLVEVSYEGELEVVDATALRIALCEGIGRAKAYGCGLLTLSPAKG